MDWRSRVIREDNYFHQGLGKLSSLRYFLTMYGLLEVWVATQGITYNRLILIPFFLSIVILIWAFGRTWDKIGLYHKGATFSNERNPIMIRLDKYLKKRKF